MSDTTKNGTTVKWIGAIITLVVLVITIVYGTVQTAANFYISRQNEFLVKSLDKVEDNRDRIINVEKSYMVIQEQLKTLNEKVDKLMK